MDLLKRDYMTKVGVGGSNPVSQIILLKCVVFLLQSTNDVIIHLVALCMRRQQMKQLLISSVRI